MAKNLYRRRAIMVKLGTGTYPADSTPDENDIVLTYNFKFMPFEGNREKLDPDRDFVGSGIEYYTGPHAKVTFDVHIPAAGSAGVEPALGKLLQMCGMPVTIDAGVSVTYALTSDLLNSEWGSIYVVLHGNELHKMTGCRGSVKWALNKEGMPMLSFEFLGLWDQTPVAGSVGVVDYSVFEKPLPANAANTTKITIDGYTACCEKAEFDLGHEVKYRNLLGCESILILDRSATANFTIEKPTLADKDFFAMVRTHKEVVGTISHGTTAGGIWTFPFRGQASMGSDEDSDGLAVLPLSFNLIPSDAGNDELSAVIT